MLIRKDRIDEHRMKRDNNCERAGEIKSTLTLLIKHKAYMIMDANT
jgi:hypothetical protein